jgi:protein-disulfide isomerase
VAERVEHDFRTGVRAGVTSTPTLFVDGDQFPGVPDAALLARL